MTACLGPLLAGRVVVTLCFLVFVFNVASECSLAFCGRCQIVRMTLVLFFTLMTLLGEHGSIAGVRKLFFTFVTVNNFF